MIKISPILMMMVVIGFLIATISCDNSKPDGSQSTQSSVSQKSWPETAVVRVTGKLQVGFAMGELTDKGVDMIQHVTLRSGSKIYILRCFPGTKNVVPTVEGIMYLLAEGVNGGFPVALDVDYDVEGILLRKAIEESTIIETKNLNNKEDKSLNEYRLQALGIDTSKPVDHTELAINKLVQLMFRETDAVDISKKDVEARFQELILQAIYEKVLYADMKDNPDSEVLFVKRLVPVSLNHLEIDG